MTKPVPKIVKITLELTEQEYFDNFEKAKIEYREKTGKYRSNTDVWRDQIEESKHYRITGIQKSQRIEQQYSENLEIKKNTKDYVESLKMTCPKCGCADMGIKLDYDVMMGWKNEA